MSDQDSLRLRVAIGDTQNPMSGTWFVSSIFIMFNLHLIGQVFFFQLTKMFI